MTAAAKPISICICTSGRPRELLRCMASIAAGTRLPFEVIVSDDGGDPSFRESIQAVCECYLFVHYVSGPRRGLCANRNHVLRHATGTHVSLLDDDAIVHADFMEKCEALIAQRPDVIWTGDVLEDGVRRQSPTNSAFLGHFGRPVRPGERLENINLNCNIFPRIAFAAGSFDEAIAYGYEDTDLCAQLIAVGFEIRHAPDLINSHLPPSRAADDQRRHWMAERARFYTRVRHHGRWQPNVWRLAAFAAIAPLHLMLHAIQRGNFRRVADGWTWIARDLLSLLRR